MDDFFVLRDAVRQLEGAWEIPEQLALLQRLNDLLLDGFCLDLGAGLLLPLWVEAYYYHPGKFEDQSTHRSPGQAGRFGRLYLHRKGWGGADLCLSLGEYCLSCLLKYSLVEGEFLSQLGLRDRLGELLALDPGLADRFVLAPLPEALRDRRRICHSPRKGLGEGPFREACLASVKGVGEFPFRYERGFGAKKLLSLDGRTQP